jgi:energy-coupling factor transporter ATP-binding protein EcfA2
LTGNPTIAVKEANMIKKLEIKNFTCFADFTLDLVEGINLFIGDNGTGKTHILKLLYSIQSAPVTATPPGDIISKILRVFMPRNLASDRLLRKGGGNKKEGSFSINQDDQEISCKVTQKSADGLAGTVYSKKKFTAKPVYIPVKEMLANAPGFRSLYAEREIHYEEIYPDIIDKAFLPPLKDVPPQTEKILKRLQKTLGGKVSSKNEEFYLRTRAGEIEFSLVAEGYRKLALLWLLLRNGSLSKGATLYWDEPEANLNPSMFPLLVEILLSLQKEGVQIFIATHSYALLKEFDLQRTDHSLRFYALHKDADDATEAMPSESYAGLAPNKIAEQFARIYDLEVELALGGR